MLRYILFEFACAARTSVQDISRNFQDEAKLHMYPRMRAILESAHEAHLVVVTDLIITLMIII